MFLDSTCSQKIAKKTCLCCHLLPYTYLSAPLLIPPPSVPCSHYLSLVNRCCSGNSLLVDSLTTQNVWLWGKCVAIRCGARVVSLCCSFARAGRWGFVRGACQPSPLIALVCVGQTVKNEHCTTLPWEWGRWAYYHYSLPLSAMLPSLPFLFSTTFPFYQPPFSFSFFFSSSFFLIQIFIIEAVFGRGAQSAWLWSIFNPTPAFSGGGETNEPHPQWRRIGPRKDGWGDATVLVGVQMRGVWASAGRHPRFTRHPRSQKTQVAPRAPLFPRV